MSRPAPNTLVRIRSRRGEPYGTVDHYGPGHVGPDLPVTDDDGVTRRYPPEDLEIVWSPCLI